MKRIFRTAVSLTLVGWVIGFAGCKGGEDATDVETTETSVQGTAEADPIEVPDGTPEELFAFMDEVSERELPELHGGEEVADDPTQTEQEKEDDYGRRLIRLMKSRLVACDKIINGDPPAESKTRAIRIRLDAMRTLAALRPETHTVEFEEYATQLAAGNDPFIRRIAKSIQFQAGVNRYISQANQTPDEVFKMLDDLLAQPEAGPEVFNAVRDATGWIFQNGDVETATTLYRKLGDHFSNHSDEILAAEATNIQSQSIELGLKQVIFNISTGKAKPSELVGRVKQLIAPKELDEPILAYAMQTASFLENDGHYKEAKETYDLVYDRFANDGDEETALAVQRSIDYARKRLGLLGTELTLDGVRLSGKPFDWNKYRGKWMVVCFWTSWHTEWKSEVARIRTAVREYGDQVEVVLINMDDDRNALERYVQENPTRWPIVVSPDPATPGFENRNAMRCGVEAVPFVLLTDPQAKVTDIHLLGDRLGKALQARVK